jgi:hypothetical protein
MIKACTRQSTEATQEKTQERQISERINMFNRSLHRRATQKAGAIYTMGKSQRGGSD